MSDTPITDTYRADVPYQDREWMKLLLASHERLERENWRLHSKFALAAEEDAGREELLREAVSVLQAMVNSVPHGQSHDATFAQARSVIEKATGSAG